MLLLLAMQYLFRRGVGRVRICTLTDLFPLAAAHSRDLQSGRTPIHVQSSSKAAA